MRGVSEGISNTLFHDSSRYPLTRDGSNSFPTTRTEPFFQLRRQFPRPALLSSTPSGRLHERCLNAIPSPVKTSRPDWPTTVRAVLDVDIEHPLQQLRPTYAPVPIPGWRVVAIVRVCRCSRHRRRLRRNGHHRLTQLRIRCQHSMKADQVQSRSGHQRGQTLHEFHRCQLMVAGAITLRRPELQHHRPGAVHTQALVGNPRAGESLVS